MFWKANTGVLGFGPWQLHSWFQWGKQGKWAEIASLGEEMDKLARQLSRCWTGSFQTVSGSSGAWKGAWGLCEKNGLISILVIGWHSGSKRRNRIGCLMEHQWVTRQPMSKGSQQTVNLKGLTFGGKFGSLAKAGCSKLGNGQIWKVFICKAAALAY